jgi:[ribosomal protein S5]-alanine N-acetyltransferase
MSFLLRTNRLMLRDYLPEDYALVREIFLNRKLAAFHLNGQDTEAYVTEHLEYGLAQTHWQPRMAYDLVMATATGETIGLCGLKPSLSQSGFNTGNLNWHVKPQHWRHGYATEAAACLLAFGFEQLNLSVIEAKAFADNAASLRVMEKIGLHPAHNNQTTAWWRGLTYGEARPVVHYQLTNIEWLASRAHLTTSQPSYQFKAAA